VTPRSGNKLARGIHFGHEAKPEIVFVADKTQFNRHFWAYLPNAFDQSFVDCSLGYGVQLVARGNPRLGAVAIIEEICKREHPLGHFNSRGF
jgi:hypothetical protein